VNRKHDSGLSAAARFALPSRGLGADPLLCRELTLPASRNRVATDEQVRIFAGDRYRECGHLPLTRNALPG